jgi:valyl-tRNA synthetase
VLTTGSRAARHLSGWDDELPESIMVAPWPEAGPLDENAERNMVLVTEIIRSVRATRSEYRVDPAKYIAASIAAGPELPVLRGAFGIISRLARLEPLQVYDVMAERPKDAVALLVGEVTVYLPLAELTDVEAELARLRRELEGAQKAFEAVQKKLTDERFLSRAPDQVVQRDRERAQTLTERIRRLQERLDVLEGRA